MRPGFTRERVMHELRRRELRVLRAEMVAPRMRRIVLGGSDLEGFTSPAPADHVKLFFTDDADEQVMRDYTPLHFNPTAEGGPELTIDFVLHGESGHGGPATRWASEAQPGDTLTIGGPRGSLLPPEGVANAILVADETALPSVARWLDALADTQTTLLLSLEDAGTASYLTGYEAAHRELHIFSGDDRDTALESALRDLPIGEGTFGFLAGEATALVPLRRYLRRELGLPKEQVDAHGYWKRGEANLDHHAPLDPSDPD